MADFSKALAITLENEGGFADRSQTTGEVVNMGVTLATLRGLGICKGDLPCEASNISAADVAFVKSLTVDDVEPIYRQQYWDKLSLDSIQDQNLANQLFDLAVNDGPIWPTWWLQHAVNTPPDGQVGPITIAATNAEDPKDTLVRVRAYAALHYQQAEPAADRPQWLARLAKMGELAGLPEGA